MRIGILSTFPPRECGIATFAQDVSEAMKLADPSTTFVRCAISDQSYDYPAEVAFQIDQSDRAAYTRAADFFNESTVDAVLIQHEFGIFGGYNGRYLLDFVRQLRKPFALALHTVPMLKTSKRRVTRLALLRQLCERAAVTFVTTPSALQVFADAGFPVSVRRRMRAVPHGAPLLTSHDRAQRSRIRAQLAIKNEDIMLLTFGLITPNKGLEYMVRAVRTLVRQFPTIKYVIAGKTHPKKSPTYMDQLRDYIERHGLEEYVVFLPRYLSHAEILGLLAASDMYVVPYLTKGQVSSGTLAYAMAAGKPIVATKFSYAIDLLARNRGMLVDFRSSTGFVQALSYLMTQPNARAALAARALRHGRQFAWPRIGKAYLAHLTRALA